MKSKKNIRQVVEKELPDFVAAIAGLSQGELDARLIQLAKDAEANDQAKEDDEQLETAQAQVSEFSAPYRDAKKAIKLKSKYIISLLKDGA